MQTCVHADMNHIVTLICWRGVTPPICQAVMLTYSHAGMGQTNMLTATVACCHAEMRKSGHAVTLTCWRAPKPELEEVSWFLLVAVLS